jgi:hypothetical protein
VIRVLTAVAAVLALASPAEASASCQRHGSKTIHASRSARAYELRGTVYACLYATGRPYKLGVNDGDFGDVVAPIRLRGAFAGFVRQSEDHYGHTDATVVVKDLRNGRVLNAFSKSGFANEVCAGAPPPYEVSDLALAPTGAVAWIATVGYCDGARQKVTTMATGQPLGVLDDDAAVDPNSLRYARGSVFWARGGEEHSAPLR